MGRPKGVKDSKPRGYTLSPAAYHQRTVANLKHGGSSRVMQQIIKREELTPEQTEILAEEKMSLWKRMQTPALMLMDEYVELKNVINAKLMSGTMDVTDKEYQALAKILLDLTKETNRLTQVSADKKMEAFGKAFDEEEVIDVFIDE